VVTSTLWMYQMPLLTLLMNTLIILVNLIKKLLNHFTFQFIRYFHMHVHEPLFFENHEEHHVRFYAYLIVKKLPKLCDLKLLFK